MDVQYLLPLCEGCFLCQCKLRITGKGQTAAEDTLCALTIITIIYSTELSQQVNRHLWYIQTQSLVIVGFQNTQCHTDCFTQLLA